METIQNYLEEMDKLYLEFCDSVDDFIMYRKLSNKKKVVEKSRAFSRSKNKLTCKIRDCYCKGEEK